jgi:hypothetical protein
MSAARISDCVAAKLSFADVPTMLLAAAMAAFSGVLIMAISLLAFATIVAYVVRHGCVVKRIV